ncbi:hypothetical protein GCM10027578_21050 [Spirosoma luteolum]
MNKVLQAGGTRLDTLNAYSILDSLPEQEYDDLTQLASQLCQTPISLITLLTDERQLIKSNHGVVLGELPRQESFCTHALATPYEPMIVTDARNDPRFVDNALVTGEPEIVFYAGMPLTTDDGMALGTLCVLDQKPRQLTPEQLNGLRILARQVMTLLELRKANAASKASEERYRQLVSDLDKQVQQRTEELQQTNNQLSEANENLASYNAQLIRSNSNLQQFAFVASHDLQEPLRKIQSFGALLIDRYSAGMDSAGIDMLNRIVNAGSRMSMLIRDLLSYSRISTRREEDRRVALNEVIEAVQNDLDLMMTETGTQLSVADLPVISGDRRQLEQLFQNLIGNAIKFRRPEVPPQIVVTTTCIAAEQLPVGLVREGNALQFYRIDVVDNGIGFEQQYADKIFQVFQRLHNQKAIPGSGIGLAICEKVALNHGGGILATSSLGAGATFSIYFPVPVDTTPA